MMLKSKFIKIAENQKPVEENDLILKDPDEVAEDFRDVPSPEVVLAFIKECMSKDPDDLNYEDIKRKLDPLFALAHKYSLSKGVENAQ